jgi:hypothetical protein
VTLLRCSACRWAGMIHCSQPEYCDGMKLPTWDETEDDLIKIQQAFVALHNTGEKNWTPDERRTADHLRKRCVELAEYRYSLIRKTRDEKINQ